jgi:Ca2+:H+ antiporter
VSTRESLRAQFEVARLEGVQSRKSPVWGALDATKAFVSQIRDLICGERINVLLLVVPVGIAVGLLAKSDPIVVFILNALSIIPLAVIISTATESLASRLGDTTGALLNVTVGNAAEMLIFFTALVKDQLRIVQASLLGSILANSLLVLGTANICGGLRFGNQLYDRASGRLSVCLLDVGLVTSMLPVSTNCFIN